MSTSNDSKPARPTRRNLNLASPPDSALDRIAVLYGDQDLNINVPSILERYLVMLHRAIPKFSDREICVVIDALGDSWEPTPTNIGQIPREVLTAIITDRLDAKWGIDTDKFSSRLDRTSFYERTTLAEITAAYWRLATPDSRPQDIISQIKKLLRPASSPITPTTRPRRISAHLFEQDPPASTGPATSGDDEGDTDGANPDATDHQGADAEGTDQQGPDAEATDQQGPDAEGTDPSSSADADGTGHDGDTVTTDTGEADNGDGADPTDAGEPAASGSPQDPLL